MPSGYPCVKITWKRTRGTEVGHGKCAILGKKFGEYRRTNHKKKNMEKKIGNLEKCLRKFLNLVSRQQQGRVLQTLNQVVLNPQKGK